MEEGGFCGILIKTNYMKYLLIALLFLAACNTYPDPFYCEKNCLTDTAIAGTPKYAKQAIVYFQNKEGTGASPTMDSAHQMLVVLYPDGQAIFVNVEAIYLAQRQSLQYNADYKSAVTADRHIPDVGYAKRKTKN
jgi:hypothetical protein